MKKFLCFMLGITMATVLFTGCKKKNDEVIPEVPSETIASETNKNESNDNKSQPEKYTNIEDVRKDIAQNKSKIMSGDTDGIASEYLEYFVHIDKQFGMHYFAPEGMKIVPERDAGEYYSKVAEQFHKPFFLSSKLEFVCSSEDGKQCLWMIINKLKDSNMSLDQLVNSSGSRNICGKTFIDTSHDGGRVYCRQDGDYVITISTTSDSFLSGFVS